MKKIIPLIFLVLYAFKSNSQAVGGWGTCEFATVATMNAFDPSTNAYDCKKVFVQATNEHYYWNGTIWVLVQDTNTDDQNASEVPFTPVGTIVATDVQAAIAEIEPDIYGSVGVHSDVDVTTTTPSNGDVLTWNGTNFVPSADALNNIYNTDDDLTANRTVGLDGNDLTFDGTNDIIIQADGDVGIGVALPSTQFDVDGTGLFRNGAPWSGGGNGQLQFGFNGTDDYRHTIKTRHNNSNNAYNGIDFYVWQVGVDGVGDLASSQVMTVSGRNSGSLGIGTTSPNAKFEVNGGNVRFTDYGTGTYDEASPARLLGVQADGDIVEVDLSAQGLQENIYNTDDDLTADRTVGMDGNSLTFDATRDIVFQADGDVGIGGISPTTNLDVNGIGLFRNGASWSGGGNGQIQFGFNSTDTYRHGIKSRHNNGNNNYNGLDFYVWQVGVDAVGDLASSQVMTISGANSGSVGIGTIVPNAKFEVNGGNVRFTDYGTGSYDEPSPARLLGVQADGDIVEVDLSADGLQDNIYNTDDDLTANRTVGMDGNSLTFDATRDIVFQADGDVGIGGISPTTNLDINGIGLFRNGSSWNNSGNNGQIQFGYDGSTDHRHAIKSRHSNTNNSYNGLDFFVWQFGVDAVGDLASSRVMTISGRNSGSLGIGTHVPNAKLEVSGGNVRFTDYGTGTYDEASPARLLGVQADGDVIEVDLAANGFQDNIYNTDGTLTGNRSMTMDGNNLTFDGTGDVIIEADGDVGIGTASPTGQLHVANQDNINGFLFESSNVLTGEKDVFSIIDNDVGGGGQDHSSVLKVHKNATINDSDEGFSLIELANTGTNPNGNEYWISGRKSDEGAPEWGVQISDNQIWSSGGMLLNATGAANGTYSGGDFIVESGGDVGIGTITPDAKLDVENGTVRFSDYGAGTNTGTQTFLLGVDVNGDVIETPLVTNTDDQTATEVNITDAGGNFTSTNVEGALAELATATNDNIYTTNGTLDGNRTVELDGNNLTFDGTSDVIIQADGDVGIGTAPSQDFDVNGVSLFRNGNSSNTFTNDQLQFSYNSGADYRHSIKSRHNSGSPVGNSLDFYIWNQGTDASSDVGTEHVMTLDGNNNGSVGIGTTSPDAKFDVEGGTVRFSDYGGGTITGTTSYILAVDTDGDIIEVDPSTLGGGSGDNIYTADGALGEDRTVEMDGNNLTFDGTGTGDVVIESGGDVGIGNTNPNNPLHITEPGLGTSASATNGTIFLEHTTSGGANSIVFESAANAGSDYGYIEYSDDGSGNGSTSENSLLVIGTENDVAGIYQDDIAIMPSGYLGVGTTSPDAKLDVDGGTVKFSDYGGGTVTGTTSYILAVDSDGDIIEVDPSTLGGSTSGAIGTIYIADGDDDETSLSTGVPVKADGETTLINAVDVDMPADNRLRYTGSETQTFFVSCNISARVDNNRRQIYYSIRKNGADVPSINAATHFREDDGNNELNSTTITGTVELSTNDYVELWIENVEDGSDVTVRFMNLSLFSTNGGSGGSGSGSSDNIYTANGTLGGNRTVGMNGNNLTFDATADMIIQADGSLGIGTTTPDAILDVEGGQVRFSDYGETPGNYEDTTAVYLLGVDPNGDVMEMNTAKSSRIFYPPAIAIVADAIDTDLELDLHDTYVNLFTGQSGSFIASSSAPGAIPTYEQDELYYYILDYDTAVFDNVTIDANGLMVYDVIAPASGDCSFINIVFVVKEP
ncbi:MAG: beta strand repeat-containing protein [Saprospiraceae bacterium]